MKITGIRLFVLEDPDQPQYYHVLKQVPGLRRTQYTHGSKSHPKGGNLRQHLIRVETNEGIEGMCTTTMDREQVGILRTQVLGKKPAEPGRIVPAAP